MDNLHDAMSVEIDQVYDGLTENRVSIWWIGQPLIELVVQDLEWILEIKSFSRDTLLNKMRLTSPSLLPSDQLSLCFLATRRISVKGNDDRTIFHIPHITVFLFSVRAIEHILQFAFVAWSQISIW